MDSAVKRDTNSEAVPSAKFLQGNVLPASFYSKARRGRCARSCRDYVLTGLSKNHGSLYYLDQAIGEHLCSGSG